MPEFSPEELRAAAAFLEGMQRWPVTVLVDLDAVVKTLPGNLVVVAGRPAMGKSALTLGIALSNASSGRPTPVHSMEMGQAEVLNRVLAARSGYRCATFWTAGRPSRTATGRA